MADENQQSARTMARVSIGLIVLMMATGAYTYTTQRHFSEFCASVGAETRASKSPAAQKLGRELVASYCS
jgi:hypothetical protein